MKPTGNLDDIIDEFRREHRAVEAPKQLEALLRGQAARKADQAQIPLLREVWAWGLSFVLLASVLCAVAVWEMRRSHEPVNSQTGSTPSTTPSLHSSPETAALATPTPKQRVEQSSLQHPRPNAMRSPEQNSLEVSMDDFVALPASEGLPPASAISLVRMQIQQNALQQYGLEVPAETEPRTLLAEFAVGEDGLPRAIRIVR